jgi:hypothetical protein
MGAVLVVVRDNDDHGVQLYHQITLPIMEAVPSPLHHHYHDEETPKCPPIIIIISSQYYRHHDQPTMKGGMTSTPLVMAITNNNDITVLILLRIITIIGIVIRLVNMPRMLQNVILGVMSSYSNIIIDNTSTLNIIITSSKLLPLLRLQLQEDEE